MSRWTFITRLQTVEEALRFSAHLRQPRERSKEEKDDVVKNVISVLEMEDIADALVGNINQGVGITIEQRKRLTMAVELVATPQILFMDEPTTGLDSQDALHIVQLLRILADDGQAVLCTIHQPSGTLFQYFDSVILLAANGVTAYFGEIGPNAQNSSQVLFRSWRTGMRRRSEPGRVLA